jgi:hypothetical protein
VVVSVDDPRLKDHRTGAALVKMLHESSRLGEIDLERRRTRSRVRTVEV